MTHSMSNDRVYGFLLYALHMYIWNFSFDQAFSAYDHRQFAFYCLEISQSKFLIFHRLTDTNYKLDRFCYLGRWIQWNSKIKMMFTNLLECETIPFFFCWICMPPKNWCDWYTIIRKVETRLCMQQSKLKTPKQQQNARNWWSINVFFFVVRFRISFITSVHTFSNNNRLLSFFTQHHNKILCLATSYLLYTHSCVVAAAAAAEKSHAFLILLIEVIVSST